MIRVTLALFLVSPLAAAAQQIGQNAPAGGNARGHVLHQHPAGGRNGHREGQERQAGRRPDARRISPSPKTGPQTIRFFEFQKVPEAAEPEPPLTHPASAPLQQASRKRRLPGAAGRYSLPRSPPAGALFRHDRDAAAGSVARHHGGAEVHPHADDAGRSHGDHAIHGGAVRVLSDFTDDRERLLSILETMIVGEARASTKPPATTAPPTPARPSARTTASSTSSIPTGSCRRCRPRRRCWAS